MSRNSGRALVIAAGLLVPFGAFAQGGAASGGTGGSAAAGGTSASTLGTGGTSTGPAGTGSSLATGGSAAAAGGKAQSGSHVNNGGGNVLNGQAKAQAHDGGTFSKSHTKTQVKAGEEVGSRTKSMSHVLGEKPVKSTTGINAGVSQ